MRQELGILVGLALAALLYGWSTGAPLTATLVALALYSGWHLAQLLRLTRRLASGVPVRPPYPPGLWRPVYANIERLRQKGRKHKRRLTRFSDRFREAAAAMPDATMILSRDFRIDWFNRAALELFRLPRQRTLGLPLSDAIPHPILESYLQTGDFSRPLEFSPPANKGVMLSVQLVPFGRKHQLLLVGRNITRVYHIDQVRRDFVSNVSHELRTPLTVLNGFLETMLAADPVPPGQQRALELMHGQTERMQAIVSDLLTLSRLEFSTDTEHWRSVAVSRLLASIVDEARCLSGDRRHEISLRADSKLQLRGDREELRTAFSNLIFNAVQHTPARARVDVVWQQEDRRAVLMVTDSGEGIPARHLARLSERFYRVDPGRSRKSGGTGLGLAIVKHVVSRHGGELKIASIEGKGSCFTCEFPQAEASDRAEDPVS